MEQPLEDTLRSKPNLGCNKLRHHALITPTLEMHNIDRQKHMFLQMGLRYPPPSVSGYH